MLPLATLVLLGGIILGQRFRVLILVPLSLLTVLIALIVGWTYQQGVWTAAEGGAAAIVALQVGYLGGLRIRHFALLLRASRRSRSHVSSAVAQRSYSP